MFDFLERNRHQKGVLFSKWGLRSANPPLLPSSMISCGKHPGEWISKHKIFGSGNKSRDCPICQKEKVVTYYDDYGAIFPHLTSEKSTFDSESDRHDTLVDDFASDGVSRKGGFAYPSGDRYEGSVVNSKKHGHGKYTYADGEIYDGEWHEDQMHGYGVFLHKNGDIYRGQHKDDAIHGEGTYIYADGSIYAGHFANGFRNGHGAYATPNDGIYEGEFANNLKHGQGKFTYTDGSIYVGTFQNDVMCGQGTLTYPTGGNYAGSFLNDKFHGQGRVTYEDGLVVDAEYIDGKQVEIDGISGSIDGVELIGELVVSESAVDVVTPSVGVHKTLSTADKDNCDISADDGGIIDTSTLVLQEPLLSSPSNTINSNDSTLGSERSTVPAELSVDCNSSGSRDTTTSDNSSPIVDTNPLRTSEVELKLEAENEVALQEVEKLIFEGIEVK